MPWRVKNGLLYESHLERIPWLKHFFTLRSCGDTRKSVVIKRICRKKRIPLSSLVRAEQVHSSKVYIVRKKVPQKPIPGADSLVTNLPGIPLAVFTADCLPVFLVEQKQKIIGLIHAGRRGSLKNIVFKTVKKFQDTYGSLPADLVAVFAPHIRSCCYPFDLTKANYQQLITVGVKKENIFLDACCTCCESSQFFSYHREKENAGRMMGLMMIEKERKHGPQRIKKKN